MVSFFSTAICKKDTIFGAAQTNYWSFLFCHGFSGRQGSCLWKALNDTNLILHNQGDPSLILN